MTPTLKHINWARFALYVLSSSLLFVWFLSRAESQTFSFEWFRYPGLYLGIAVYIIPVLAFQYLAARFLLAREKEMPKTVLSTLIGLMAGFFFYGLISMV
jgi:hypothetical protein